MFSNILKRPVLGIVISVLIVFLGCLSIVKLPISQFPQIAPTVVNLFIAYPGASADVLTQSTLVPLEAAINGVQGMRYLSSDATSAGEATVDGNSSSGKFGCQHRRFSRPDAFGCPQLDAAPGGDPHRVVGEAGVR